MQASRKQKFRYWFDGFMAQGSLAAFTALTVVFLSALALLALLRVIFVAALGYGDDDIERGGSALRQVFLTFLEITDPGSMTQDVESSPSIKVFAIIAGMIGIVLFSALIAFVTTALDQKLSDLRKGHSQIIEEDHTLILGWNDRILDILSELILANESEPSATVAILADRDKEEMDDYLNLNLKLKDRLTTKIVTRSGATSSLVNLEVVSAESARSVIILSSAAPGDTKNDLDRSDMSVIKSILATRQILESGSDVPVVAELFSAQRRDLARSLDPEHVVCIDAEDILAKILVQTSRSEGLAVVYEEILSFDGAEMYFFHHDWQSAAFAQVAYLMPDGVPVGVLTAEGLKINPPPTYRLQPVDQLLVLANDDSTITLLPAPVASPEPIRLPQIRRSLKAERELVVGWTPKLETLVREYNDYVKPGSMIDIVLRSDDASKTTESHRLSAEVPNIHLSVKSANPFDTDELRELNPKQYDNIIILSETGNAGGTEWADAETLLILMQLQQILKDEPQPHPTLIAEVLDSKNRELINQTGVSEFIISNRLISMLAAQMSEDARLFNVYENLFSEDGSEVYLKPMSLYFDNLPRQIRFADIMAAAQHRGEVALGYRRLADSNGPESKFGVNLIPPKDQPLDFTPHDYVVVLAEDET